MTQQYDTSPEAIPSDSLPEVYSVGDQQSGWYHNTQTPISSNAPSYVHDNSHYLPVKQETQAVVNPNPVPDSENVRKPSRTGTSCVVIILGVALAIATCAAIGLAAATGVYANRWQTSTSELQALRASDSSTPTSTATAASATSSDEAVDITNGCSAKHDTVSGTTYQSNFFNGSDFTMYCNNNAPNPPIFALFSGDFHGCIEACNNWNNYNTTQQNCEAVSFIPFWASINDAAKNKAPGDCYLKPGPQSRGKLDDAPNTHAAILK